MASKQQQDQGAECVDFMDFNEASDTVRVTGGVAAFHRPYLSTEKEIVYEDRDRNVQVLNEMHKFYRNGSLCDVVLHAGRHPTYVPQLNAAFYFTLILRRY